MRMNHRFPASLEYLRLRVHLRKAGNSPLKSLSVNQESYSPPFPSTFPTGNCKHSLCAPPLPSTTRHYALRPYLAHNALLEITRPLLISFKPLSSDLICSPVKSSAQSFSSAFLNCIREARRFLSVTLVSHSINSKKLRR